MCMYVCVCVYTFLRNAYCIQCTGTRYICQITFPNPIFDMSYELQF